MKGDAVSEPNYAEEAKARNARGEKYERMLASDHELADAVRWLERKCPTIRCYRDEGEDGCVRQVCVVQLPGGGSQSAIEAAPTILEAVKRLKARGVIED